MALAQILPRFDVEPNLKTSLATVFSARTAEQARAHALAEAEQRGHEKGFAAARAELEATIAAERASFEQRVREERARWVAEEGERLSAGWDGMLQELEAKLSDAVAGLLLPVIGAGLASKAVSELSAVIADLLSEDKRPLIRVLGPEDLLTALRMRLGPKAASMEFAPSETVDLKLVLGDTVIETQLAAWRSRLSQAIDGAPNG